MDATVGPVPEPKRMKAKVVLVGDQSTKKTDLIRPYVRDEFDDRFMQTLGAKVTKTVVTVADRGGAGDVEVTLRLWDTVGSKTLASALTSAILGIPADFYRGAEGVLAVCDAAKPETLRGLNGWIASIYSMVGRLPTYILVRADQLENAVVTEEEVARLATTYGSPYAFVPAEATEAGRVVEAAFMYLASKVAEGWVAAQKGDEPPGLGYARPPTALRNAPGRSTPDSGEQGGSSRWAVDSRRTEPHAASMDSGPAQSTFARTETGEKTGRSPPQGPEQSRQELVYRVNENRLTNEISGWERSEHNPDLWRRTWPNGDLATIEYVGGNECRWRLLQSGGKGIRGTVQGNLADAAHAVLNERLSRNRDTR